MSSAAAPPTLLQKIVIFLCLSNEAISFTSIVSYVGMLCLHFQEKNLPKSSFTNSTSTAFLEPTSVAREEAGKWSGLVVGVYQLGQIIVNRKAGSISDRHGRRIVILFGQTFGLLSNVAFGLSSSLPQALAARILMGLCNANNVAIKSIIADLGKRSGTGGTQLFATMNAVWNASSAGSAALCALLYGMWFADYPALAPMMLVVAVNLLSLIMAYFYLPETNQAVLDREALASASADVELDEVNIDDESDVVKEDDGGEEPEAPPSSFGYSDMFNEEHRTLLLANLAYVSCCAAQIIFIEVFPLLAILHSVGYGWEPSMIGTAFAVQGAGAFLSTFFVTDLCDKFGKLRVLRWSAAIWAICSPLFVTVAMLKGQPLLFYILLFPIIVIRAVAATFAFTLSSAKVADSAPSQHLGSVTGISQTSGNLIRGIFPLLATPLFAFTVSPDKSSHALVSAFQNVYVVFVINGLVCLCILASVAGLSHEDLHPVSATSNDEDADAETTVGADDAVVRDDGAGSEEGAEGTPRDTACVS